MLVTLTRHRTSGVATAAATTAGAAARRFLSSQSSGTTTSTSTIDVAAIQKEMRRRPPKTISDILSPTPSHLLNIALSDFLPSECQPTQFTRSSNSSNSSTSNPLAHSIPDLPTTTPPAPPLPQGHHLVYFPLQLPPSLLLPDGTDPAQSPDPARLPRRMWAGGSVTFAPPGPPVPGLELDGRRAICVETLGAVVPRGANLFVDVWRRYGTPSAPPAIEERRTLVFLPPPPSPAPPWPAPAGPRAPVRMPHAPDLAFALTPSRALLFHFSALTFNAHAIHLDAGYGRGLEGHRDLLVHGPLSLVLMLAALRGARRGEAEGEGVGGVRRIDYRNYAPLYAGEAMRVCVRRSRGEGRGGEPAGEKKWDVWVEGPDGGLAVKGTAVA